jgi:uncharacterized protein YbjT (DUF2867 family)
VILVCGATGLLGGEIARRLAAQGQPWRALVRSTTDATLLQEMRAEVVRGDLREPDTLMAAVNGAATVVTTVTAMSRLLAGAEKTTIDETDGQGTANLIEAAERAGVKRFVYVSFAGCGPHLRFPLARAKFRSEQRLRSSVLQEVLIKPDAFQEVWLSSAVGIDLGKGKMIVYGKGGNPVPYVAVGDVAEVVVRLALEEDPPQEIEFGGPEAHTRNQIAKLIQDAAGRHLRVLHIPRSVLRMGSRALAPFKQELASVMGIALEADTIPRSWDATPLRRLGIDPRPTTAYIRALAAAP